MGFFSGLFGGEATATNNTINNINISNINKVLNENDMTMTLQTTLQNNSSCSAVASNDINININEVDGDLDFSGTKIDQKALVNMKCTLQDDVNNQFVTNLIDKAMSNIKNINDAESKTNAAAQATSGFLGGNSSSTNNTSNNTNIVNETDVKNIIRKHLSQGVDIRNNKDFFTKSSNNFNVNAGIVKGNAKFNNMNITQSVEAFAETAGFTKITTKMNNDILADLQTTAATSNKATNDTTVTAKATSNLFGIDLDFNAIFGICVVVAIICGIAYLIYLKSKNSGSSSTGTLTSTD